MNWLSGHIDLLMNVLYTEVMSKHTKPDWTRRKNITLPEDMFDFVETVAETRRLPIYQLVYDAVDLYARVNPPIKTNGTDNA